MKTAALFAAATRVGACIGNKSKKDSPKSTNDDKESIATYSSAEGLECPTCGSDIITKSGPRDKICTVCRHRWV